MVPQCFVNPIDNNMAPNETPRKVSQLAAPAFGNMRFYALLSVTLVSVPPPIYMRSYTGYLENHVRHEKNHDQYSIAVANSKFEVFSHPSYHGEAKIRTIDQTDRIHDTEDWK